MVRTQSRSKQEESPLAKYYLVVSADSFGEGEHAFYRTHGKAKANQICRALAADPATGDQVHPLKFIARSAANLSREACIICDRFIDSLNTISLTDGFDPTTVEANDNCTELLQLYNYLALFWDLRIRQDAIHQPTHRAVANAVVAFLKLDCLMGTYRDYPDAIATVEARQLFSNLTNIIDESLTDPSLRNCKRCYRRPRSVDAELHFDGAEFGSHLLMLHPEFDPDQLNEPEPNEHMAQLVRDCEAAADDDLKIVAKRIEQIMIVECRFPHAADRPEFLDKRRHVQLLNDYWSICSRVAIAAATLDDGVSPFPLCDVLEYLRPRFDVLFAQLTDVEGAVAASQCVIWILDYFASENPGKLGTHVERLRSLDARVNNFVVRAQQAVGSAFFQRTTAEVFFIENCNTRLNAFIQMARKCQANKLSQQQIDGSDSLPIAVSSSESDSCTDQEFVAPHLNENSTASRVVLGIPGKSSWVNGKEKKPLTDSQHAIIYRLFEAGSAGLTKDEIESIRPGARKTLRNLKKDEDWNTVISMPGRTDGRYRILI